MRLFNNIYHGKRVLVTGHTGFKGSWLSLWLQELGSDVIGMALSPDSQPNHWNILGLEIDEHLIDIRDNIKVQQAFHNVQPEIVFHLAAQPLVRRSYQKPLETWGTNVMGTANVLEACRHTKSVRAIVVITTDKCYENLESTRGYCENDRLGGHDPYSASKAGSELVAASYRNAFFNTDKSPFLATARAGNVIGGGDWSQDRLVPDLIRAVTQHEPLEIRSPYATRPWQHVLESLSGYLLLGSRLLNGENSYAEAWNFGPANEGNRTVSDVLNKLNSFWPSICWHFSETPQPHETMLLCLDSTKAHNRLQWQPVWNFETAIEKTADWYRASLESGEVISRQQLIDYATHAAKIKATWAS